MSSERNRPVPVRQVHTAEGHVMEQPRVAALVAWSDDAPLRVGHVMTAGVVCVREDVSLAAATDVLVGRNISGLPVVDEHGRAVGVISKTDVLAALGAGHPTGARVEEAMMPLAFAVEEDAPIELAIRLMAAEGIHRVVVTARDGEVVGLLSSLDVMRCLAAPTER